MDEAKAKEDLDTVVKSFLPKIKKIAKRVRSQFPSAAADDLQQAGAIGLLKAMDRYDQYDPAKSKLSTWVHRWIKGEMLMQVRKDAATHRYEREAAHAFEEEFHKQAIGSGNSLADAVQEKIEQYALSAYSRRTPEDELRTQEVLACVDMFYSELSETDREFIRLRYTEHLTLEEIGLALGYSRAALCRREQRLREQLRRRMDRGG